MKNKRVQKLSEQKLLQYGCSKEGMTYRCGAVTTKKSHNAKEMY